jgi:fumarate hydratase class II
MSQSSNDTFPTAMHLAAVTETEGGLLPALDLLIATLLRLEEENRGIVKSGRTHLEDATPIAFSQEISGWRASLERDREGILASLTDLRPLAIGGTAVGTGLNAPAGFGDAVARELTALLGTPFSSAENKFSALTSLSALVRGHAALKALAADLFKIANDVRWLASGPRCGLSEITIPENEPGSSIMPGKVNPTQCEAVTMVAVQVMANDTAVTVAASQGNFELNVFLPVAIHNYLGSVRLLGDAMRSFEQNCVSGIVANREKMESNLYSSLMTATALSPYIGYERTASLVKLAHAEGITLREAVLREGVMTAEKFDEVYHPERMI